MTTTTYAQSFRDIGFIGTAANTDFERFARWERLDHTDQHTVWANASHARNQHLMAMFANLGRRIAAPVQRWYLARKTTQALSALDNRTLADIGLSREMIPFVVEQVVTAKDQAGAETTAVTNLHEIGRTLPVKSVTPQASNTNTLRHAA